MSHPLNHRPFRLGAVQVVVVIASLVALHPAYGGASRRDDGLAPSELTDHRWRLSSVANAQRVRIEALDPKVFGPIHMRFQDNAMFWDINCSGLGGEYSVEGQLLRVTRPFPPTGMFCSTRHDEAFAILSHSFYEEMKWRVLRTTNDLSALILTSSVDGSVATFISDRPGLAPPELVERSWRLTSATDAKGSPIKALNAVPIRLGFIDTYMNWDDTCNGLSGKFVAKGQSLRVVEGGLPTTLRGCSPAVNNALKALLHAFYAEMSWSLEVSNTSRTLVLTSSVDRSVLTFVATP